MRLYLCFSCLFVYLPSRLLVFSFVIDKWQPIVYSDDSSMHHSFAIVSLCLLAFLSFSLLVSCILVYTCQFLSFCSFVFLYFCLCWPIAEKRVKGKSLEDNLFKDSFNLCFDFVVLRSFWVRSFSHSVFCSFKYLRISIFLSVNWNNKDQIKLIISSWM